MKEFIPITVEFVEAYQKKRVALRFLIIDTIAIKGMIHDVYRLYVSQKELAPIEMLPVAEKNRLWLLVSNANPERTPTEKTISCKCLYLFEQILTEKISQL